MQDVCTYIYIYIYTHTMLYNVYVTYIHIYTIQIR